AAARRDVDRLAATVRPKRNPGRKALTHDGALEQAALNSSGQLARDVASRLPPVALDRLSRSLDIDLDVEAVAGAGADDRLGQSLASVRLSLASDALGDSVRADDLAAAGPVADERLERTGRHGAS